VKGIYYSGDLGYSYLRNNFKDTFWWKKDNIQLAGNIYNVDEKLLHLTGENTQKPSNWFIIVHEQSWYEYKPRCVLACAIFYNCVFKLFMEFIGGRRGSEKRAFYLLIQPNIMDDYADSRAWNIHQSYRNVLVSNESIRNRHMCSSCPHPGPPFGFSPLFIS